VLKLLHCRNARSKRRVGLTPAAFGGHHFQMLEDVVSFGAHVLVSCTTAPAALGLWR
jgi:hypothetical protein